MSGGTEKRGRGRRARMLLMRVHARLDLGARDLCRSIADDHHHIVLGGMRGRMLQRAHELHLDSQTYSEGDER